MDAELATQWDGSSTLLHVRDGIVVDAFGSTRVLGHDHADLRGRPFVDLVHPDDTSAFGHIFEPIPELDVSEVRPAVRLRDHNGEHLTVDVTTTPVNPERGGGHLVHVLPAGTVSSTKLGAGQRLAIDLRQRASVRMLAARNAHEIFTAVDDLLAELGSRVGCDNVAVFVENRQATSLERIARWLAPGVTDLGIERLDMSIDPDLLAVVFERPFVSDEVSSSELTRNSPLVQSIAATSLITTPIRSGGARGVLTFGRRQPGFNWSESDAVLAAAAADVLGHGLEASRNFDLLKLTYYDGPIGYSIRTWSGELVEANTRYGEIVSTLDGESPSSLDDIVHPDDREWVAQRIEQLRTGATDRLTHDVRIVGSAGLRWVRVNSVVFSPPGATETFVLTSLEDVTDTHQHREALEHATRHDHLTGLANRRAMHEAIQRYHVERGRLPNLLILDLDRFKLINDSLGHYAADELLVAVADRLRQAGSPDVLVARLGGDEFAIVVGGESDDEVHRIAERLRRLMEAPTRIDGRMIPQTVSIGVALGAECLNLAELLIRADRAMYTAKQRGRNQYVVFDDALRDKRLLEIDLERDLRRAIDHHELEVHFQPEFATADRRIVGCEALLRWRQPDGTLVPAMEWIHVAESTGLIDEMGRFSLREGCKLFASLLDLADPTLMLRINVSAREFSRPELTDLVSQALDEAGLEAHRLCLEMTETTLMDSPETAFKTLESLHDLGVQFAIDDFGTGYSSLAYLKRFPVDAVKVDRSFVDDIAVNDESVAIVRSIVGLAEALKLSVVAEGVENEAQLATLRMLGLTRAQGFLVSPAVPIDEFRSLLQNAPFTFVPSQS